MELVQLCYVSSINLKDLRLMAEFRNAMLRAATFFLSSIYMVFHFMQMNTSYIVLRVKRNQ